jgi:hypothetical protein
MAGFEVSTEAVIAKMLNPLKQPSLGLISGGTVKPSAKLFGGPSVVGGRLPTLGVSPLLLLDLSCSLGRLPAQPLAAGARLRAGRSLLRLLLVLLQPSVQTALVCGRVSIVVASGMTPVATVPISRMLVRAATESSAGNGPLHLRTALCSVKDFNARLGRTATRYGTGTPSSGAARKGQYGIAQQRQR